MDMNPTNQPVSFYGDNSRNTDSALLASLATRDYYAPAMNGASMHGQSDIRADIGGVRELIKDAECDLTQSIADAKAILSKAVSDTECNLSKEILENKFQLTKEIVETKHSLAKDIMRSEYESKLAIQTAIKEINEKAQYNCDRTNDKAQHYFEVEKELLKDIKCCVCTTGHGNSGN
jgi:hypothetical protein